MVPLNDNNRKKGIDVSRAWDVNATHRCDGAPFPLSNPLLYVNSAAAEDTCELQNVEVSIHNDGHTTRITYVASRAIDVGEELIVSYGHSYFRTIEYTRFECGMSAIAVAAARGDSTRVRELVADRRREGKDVGSLVNARAHGWTPLHEASNRGHAEAVAALVAGGAVVDQVIRSNGMTPLIIASELGHKEAIKVLLAVGASVQRAMDNGGTALMAACHGGHRDVAELLLNRGANVGQASPDGITALLLASQDGHRDVVELLLDRGADVRQANKDGMTALMAARHAERSDVVALLLSRGTQRSLHTDEAPDHAELGSRRLAVRPST